MSSEEGVGIPITLTLMEELGLSEDEVEKIGLVPVESLQGVEVALMSTKDVDRLIDQDVNVALFPFEGFHAPSDIADKVNRVIGKLNDLVERKERYSKKVKGPITLVIAFLTLSGQGLPAAILGIMMDP